MVAPAFASVVDFAVVVVVVVVVVVGGVLVVLVPTSAESTVGVVSLPLSIVVVCLASAVVVALPSAVVVVCLASAVVVALPSAVVVALLSAVVVVCRASAVVVVDAVLFLVGSFPVCWPVCAFWVATLPFVALAVVAAPSSAHWQLVQSHCIMLSSTAHSTPCVEDISSHVMCTQVGRQPDV